MPRPPARLRKLFADPSSVELPSEPHRLIAAWIEYERQALERDVREHREPWTRHEDTVMGRRELCIYDAIFNAAEGKGYSVERALGYWSSTYTTIYGRHIEVSLNGQSSPRRVPLSKAECRDPDNIAKGIITKEIRMPTGTFKLVAKTDFGKKTQLSEKIDHPFEDRTAELLSKLETLATAANDHEAELARWRAEIDAETRAKERKRRLEVMEEARWEQLREWAAEWQEAKALRAFIAAVEQSLDQGELSGRDTSWLAWAKNSADWLDPLARGRQSAKGITSWRYEPARSEYELSIWELD